MTEGCKSNKGSNAKNNSGRTVQSQKWSNIAALLATNKLSTAKSSLSKES